MIVLLCLLILFVSSFLLLANNKKNLSNDSQINKNLEILEKLNEKQLEEIVRNNLFLFHIDYEKKLNTRNFNFLSEDLKNFFIEFKEIKYVDANFILSLDEEVSYLIEIEDKVFLIVGSEGFDGHGYLLANQKNVINAAHYEGTDFSVIEEKSIYYHIVSMLLLNDKITLI